MSAGTVPAADAVLLQGFLEGPEAERQAAFRSLVERHGPMVAAVSRRVAGTDADDVAQAVFLQFARRARELTAHPALGGWLHRCALNIALRQREAARIRSRHEQEAAMDASPAALDERQQAELRAELDAGLDRLPERYRLPLLLHYLEGRPQAEVAALLGLSVNAFTSRLSRARELLREQLARRRVGVTAAVLLLFLGGTSASAAEGLPASGVEALCRVAQPGAAIPAQVAALATTPPASALPWATLAAGLAALVLAGSLWLWSAGPASENPPHLVPPTSAAVAPMPVPAPAAVAARADDDEQLLPFDALPPAVQQAVRTAAAGHRLDRCGREAEHGRRVYSATWSDEDAGTTVEVKLAEDGRILEREVERHHRREPAPAPAQPPPAAPF